MDSGKDTGIFDNIDTGYVKTVVIVLVIVAALYWLVTCDDMEHYIVYSYPKHCSSCGNMNRYDCGKCVNCGYCYTPNGTGECVPGDSNGPFFREDCLYYEYNAPGYRTNRVYPYMYTKDYPYWKRNRYYYNRRGYPKSTYRRYVGDHRRAKRADRHYRHHKHHKQHRRYGTTGSRSPDTRSSGSRGSRGSGSRGSGSRGSGSRGSGSRGSGSRGGGRR